MPTYISLMNWTDQGVREVKNSPQRLDAAKALAVRLGGEFKHFYMTMGEYDMVSITEFPDDATAARFALLVAMAGTLKGKTSKAFPEPEYREVMKSLG
jgi:uncharacterized protein with GYD domain